MKAAIGIDSGKVYATGVDREECFRKLSIEYPTFTSNPNQTFGRPSTVVADVYPEPLKIVNVRR